MAAMAAQRAEEGSRVEEREEAAAVWRQVMARGCRGRASRRIGRTTRSHIIGHGNNNNQANAAGGNGGHATRPSKRESVRFVKTGEWKNYPKMGIKSHSIEMLPRDEAWNRTR